MGSGTKEWWCRLTLRALAGSFAAVGALFLFFPDGVIDAMNTTGAWLGDFSPAPRSALRFWLSLATGYMVLVTALAYRAQQDLRRHRDLIALLALGKATSSLTCLAFYVFSRDAFIYLANFLVDGAIAGAAAAIWRAVPSLETEGAGRTGRLMAERAFDSLVETMVPAGGPFEEGARGAVTLANLESFAGSPAAIGWLLRGLDVSPFFLPPLHMRRFSRLPLAERVRILEAWEQSRLPPRRQAMHALKLLVLTHFYSRPELRARLRYPHPLERVPRAREKAA